MMTLSDAIVRLDTLGALAHEPKPSTEQVTQWLTDTARAALWTNATAYAVGAKIVPATPNGRLYQCITAGTSGASAPTWPSTGYQRMGQTVLDGTALWQDMGPAATEIYDLNAVQRSMWLWRAESLYQKYDASDGNASLKRSQMYDHALKQARRYGWRGAL